MPAKNPETVNAPGKNARFSGVHLRKPRAGARIGVYRCPVHGLIESPTWHHDEIEEDSGYYCPINLTGQPQAPHPGITDQVCGKDVEGPYTVHLEQGSRDHASHP